MKLRSAKRWDEPQLAKLIELREEEGLTHRQIAERMGVTKGQVDRQVLLLIYDQRLKERTRKAPEASATDPAPREWADVRREAKALYEEGELDHDEMAERLNLTRAQLQTQLRRLFKDGQLSPRPRGSKKNRT
jgi:predicted transcriptional regulator